MKTIKVSEAQDQVLDWLVAQAEGNVRLQYDSREGLVISNVIGWIPYRPSLAWQQGGPIIERERIDVDYDPGEKMWIGHWFGSVEHAVAYGPTPLIAAMRCYVASKLGETAEVPEELL